MEQAGIASEPQNGHPVAITRSKLQLEIEAVTHRPAQSLTSALLAIGLFAAVSIVPAASTASNQTADDSDLTFTGSYLAARSAAQEQDVAAAVRYLGRALKSDPDNPELIERTFILRVINGDVEGGLALANRLAASNSNSWLAGVVLGIEALRGGAYAKGEEYFKASTESAQALRSGPVAILVAGLLTAWAQQGLDRTDDALATIDGLTGPEWYAIFKDFHSGMIAELAGRTSEAVARMKAALKADRTGLRMIEGYARVMARAGEIEDARKTLVEFSAQAQDHPIVKSLIEELDAGKVPAPLVANPQEGAAEALYSMGVALSGDGNNDLSAIYLELALYLDPHDDLAWITLGDIRRNNRDYEKAITAFSKVSETSPLHEIAVIESSISLDALEKSEEASEALKVLLEKSPANLSAAQALGDIYQRRKDYEQAADAYSIGVQAIDQPVRSHWQLYYSRGIAFERTKRWPDAESDFRTALTLNPDQPQVLNYLGYSLVDQGLKLDEALDMIKKAVGQRPEDAYIVDSLGWAFYQLDQLDDAVRELERAVQLQPEDPVINDHLGDVYWKTGRKLEAIFQWTHARDLEPEKDQLPKILAKLKGGLDAEPAAESGAP